MKGNKLGDKPGERRTAQKRNQEGGSGSQEQPRREIMKGDKFGKQGGSGSQEQPRMEIMKGDKAAAASRPFSDFGDQQPSH